MNEPKTCVIVYTDGGASPNPGLGGWGAVLVSPGHGGLERELYGAEPDTTNNRMELTAAIQALRALKYPCRVELHTDSTYLRNTFEKGWLVKGHAGDERNNRCDALVQRAKEEFLSGMSPAAPA